MSIFQEKMGYFIGVGIAAFVSGVGLNAVVSKRKKPSPEEPFEQMTLTWGEIVADRDELHRLASEQYQDYIMSGSPDHEHASLELIREVNGDDVKDDTPTPPVIELPTQDPALVHEFIEKRNEFIDEMLELKRAEVLPIELATDLGEGEPEEQEEEPQANVFDRADHTDVWDQEAEEAGRSPEAPYIIHEDEYHNDQSGFPQKILTYYSGDDILTDEADTPIYNHHQVVGTLLFGHGSNDSRIVYVRNEEHRGEYQIMLFDGHYAQHILGLDAQDQIDSELAHMDYRFRTDD